MGFWSKLGSIASVAAPFALAPFTGGGSLLGAGSALSKIGSIAKIAGPALSGLAGAAQKGREGENAAASSAADFKQRAAAQYENALQGRAGLDLRQREFGQDSQNNAYKQALKSGLAMNMQDVGITGLPSNIPVVNFTGGARPSAIGAEGRAAGAQMNKLALQKLMDGEKFDALPPIERTAPAEYKKPGLFENLAGAVGMGANAINGANADAEQSDFQKKILAAIQALNPQKASTPPLVIPQEEGLG